jgi:hypothetical protein
MTPESAVSAFTSGRVQSVPVAQADRCAAGYGSLRRPLLSRGRLELAQQPITGSISGRVFDESGPAFRAP